MPGGLVRSDVGAAVVEPACAINARTLRGIRAAASRVDQHVLQRTLTLIIVEVFLVFVVSDCGFYGGSVQVGVLENRHIVALFCG